MNPAIQLTTPWGKLPANDNARPIMVGLTGKRNVGKSTVATMLEEEYGFEAIHAFNSGKAASVRYFEMIVGDPLEAWEMVYGHLKDKPHPALPGCVAPRFFLEKFGHFMGHTMGVEWTLGLEIARARKRAPRAPIVVESLVYEAAWFQAQGGFVVRLERPGHVGPAGVESDGVQAGIAADVTIAATSVDELLAAARGVVQQIVGGR